MSPETARRRAPHVCVAATREQAAQCFGPAYDDVLVTSFADFADEVDLSLATAVDLVAGEGMAAVLQTVAAAQQAGRPVELRCTAPTGDEESFVALLDRLGLHVTGVRSLAGRPVLCLGPEGSAGDRTATLVLQAVRAVAVDVQPTAPEEAGVSAPAGTTPDGGGRTGRPAPRPVPRLVEVLGSVHRLRDGRRRRSAALVVGLLGLVALVLLGVWADSAGTLLAVALPASVALVVLAAAAGCYTTLLLARQVDVQTGRLERAVLRNRTVLRTRAVALEQRTASLERRVAAVEKGQARFPFALEYLETLGELGAETAGRLRDLEESLAEPGHARTDSRTLRP